MSSVPESYRNMPVENNWSGYTGTAQTTTQSSNNNSEQSKQQRVDNDRRGAALVFLRWHLIKGKHLGLYWEGEFHSIQHPSKNDFFAQARTKTTLVDVLDICMDVWEEEKGDYGKIRFVAYCAGQLAVPICSFLDVNENHLGFSQIVKYAKEYEKDLKDCGLLRRKEKEDRVQTVLGSEEAGFTYIPKENLQGAFPSGIGDYAREKHIRFTHLTGGSWARIDFVIRVNGGYVFLEVDEDQHKAPGYENNVAGDMKRMAKVMMAYWHDGNELPVLWLRYNPDASKFFVNPYKTEHQCPDRNERENLLIQHLTSIDLSRDSREEQESWKIEYAFYDARVVDGKTIAETTTISHYAETYRNLSTKPKIFAWDPKYVPTEININRVSGTDEQVGTAISSMDSDTDMLDSQGTNPAYDILL